MPWEPASPPVTGHHLHTCNSSLLLSQVSVALSSSSIRVAVLEETGERVLVEGKFTHKVNTEGSVWSLEPGKCVLVSAGRAPGRASCCAAQGGPWPRPGDASELWRCCCLWDVGRKARCAALITASGGGGTWGGARGGAAGPAGLAGGARSGHAEPWGCRAYTRVARPGFGAQPPQVTSRLLGSPLWRCRTSTPRLRWLTLDPDSVPGPVLGPPMSSPTQPCDGTSL